MGSLSVVQAMRAAVRRRRLWLIADADDVVGLALTRSIESGRGVAFVEGADRDRFATVAALSAACDLARWERRHPRRPLFDNDAVDAFTPEDAAIEAEERDREAAALALARQRPTLRQLLAGRSLTEIARKKKQAPSTAMRRARQEVEEIRAAVA